MSADDKCMDIQAEDIFGNRKRGDILYYSISQVAALLDEEDSSIRYYTNVFDNILKIEISDKELVYTNKDIDTLEFLINLKNKGMTIKEVQRYCEELPLNIEALVDIKENNSISLKDIITTISELENKKIDIVSECLSNKIDQSNDLSVQKIVKLISEEQNKQAKLFRDDILKEIKEYIDCKFDIEYKIYKDSCSELFTNMNNLISEKISSVNNIKLQFDKFNDLSISRDRNLIQEIKRFENVMEQAYYIRQDLDTQKEKISFIGRLLRNR